MNMSNKLFLYFLLFFYSFSSFSQNREISSLDQDWDFHFGYDVQKKIVTEKVNIPHTWNADEVKVGKSDYYRAVGEYTKTISISDKYKGKRLFLRFEGVNSVATVLINQKTVGEHQGGYTAFCFEITDFLKYGENNLITVLANNSYNYSVLPLSGDFNVYGGIHRSVSLIVTNANCITPLDYASPGLYITQKNVSSKSAELEIKTKLSLKNTGSYSLNTSVIDRDGKVIAQKNSVISGNEQIENFTINQPHLWNGRKDPYLYQVKVVLSENQNVLDEVIQKTGLRFFNVDPEKGFFLNGQYLDLHGVCRHQDLEGKGSALTKEDHEKDLQMLNELGVTGMRLTHYPHSEYFYEGCDKAGIVLWTEIPLVGPGGYKGAGYINHPGLHAHAKQLMTELIRQHYNNPSICFWGLFNELKLDYDDPVPFLKELNALVKKEDPSRLTTCASFLDNDHFNQVSDIIGWNKYFGWYGGPPEDMGKWADDMHGKFPQKAIGISEYGAGASVKQHTEKLEAPKASGKFHPEEWQTYYHEKNWEQLKARPFLWGKFIWVFRDFGSSIRFEGDTVGINDKGLITYDNRIKKDAFYYYKANWNPEPMLYLVERRDSIRTNPVTQVKVYSTLPEAELFLNGKSMGKKIPNKYKTAIWENINLAKGKNEIKVRSKQGKKIMEDTCIWELK